MSLLSTAKAVIPWIVEGVKAIPEVIKAFRGKKPTLDAPLGESAAAKVLREAEERRRKRHG